MSDEYQEAQEAFIATSFIDFHTQASPSGEWIPMSESEAREVFEDWLAEHDAKVRAEEREKAAQIAESTPTPLGHVVYCITRDAIAARIRATARGEVET